MSNVTERSWLLFRLHHHYYAVDGQAVISILRQAPEITPLPQSSPAVRGVMLLRGGVVPLLDLRRLLGLADMEEECKAFESSLKACYESPRQFAEGLRQAALSGKPVPKMSGAFAAWCENFQPQNRTMTFHLHKMQDLIDELHHLVEEINAMTAAGKTVQNDVELEETVEDMQERILSNLYELMDEAPDIFRQSSRQMVITLEYMGERLGLLVDSVQAVRSFEETLPAAEEEPEEKIFPYVSYQEPKLGLIRFMPLQELFSLVQEGKYLHPSPQPDAQTE